MATDMVGLDTMIVATPGVSGGKPRVNGTGVTVGRIALLATAEGYSPERIVDEVFPRLSLGQVYAALAYYFLNKEAIDTQIREDGEEFERAYAEHHRRRSS